MLILRFNLEEGQHSEVLYRHCVRLPLHCASSYHDALMRVKEDLTNAERLLTRAPMLVYHKPSVPFIVPKLTEPGAAEKICRYLRGQGELDYHVNWEWNPPPRPPKPMEMGRDEDY